VDRLNAEGALVEMPKAPRGVGCGKGIPSPPEEESGDGARPLPRIFFII